MTKKFAVIGNPIEHSKSPQLHHAFAKHANLDLIYQKRLAPLDGFTHSITDFFEQDGCGLNVTVPFKEQAYAQCDELSERAKIAKAVNTLWKKNGKLYGDNTDGQGLVNALQALDWILENSKILIIGAGGATRGVIYPLAQAGVAHITIANRTIEKADTLVAELQPALNHTTLSTMPLNALSGNFDIIINATSASLSGDALNLPDALQFKYAYEMAYGKPSHFLQQAQQRNIPYSDGYGMLVGQAIESFSIWNGIKLNLQDFL